MLHHVDQIVRSNLDMAYHISLSWREDMHEAVDKDVDVPQLIRLTIDIERASG